MNILIHHVNKLRGSYGETAFPAAKKVVIRVNKRLNKGLATYGATMLHELLHAWIHILALRGFEVDDDVEHKFIYAVEQIVLKKFKKIVKRKGGR